MALHHHPDSPVMDHCPETLPVRAYLDADWFQKEQRTIWARNWVLAGRVNDLKPGTLRKVQVGAASVVLCRASGGEVTAFHNVCRHRGAELCGDDDQPMGRLINCKYHAWAYAADDGRLVSVGHATPTDDFRKQDHALHRVSVTQWAGFIFLNLAPSPGPLAPDMGLTWLDNWPMDSLVTGHRMTVDLACNWKVYWENYNECLHCPGVHPELCDLVPVYRQGIMAPNEDPTWTPGAKIKPALKAGAVSWTATGTACGPEFPTLTAEQRRNGFNFVTVYPTMFLVAHVDHVRAVSLQPTGPDTTRLTAEWYFAQETLDQPGFDAAEVAAFAKLVMAQDGAAAELNQRGMRSPAYTHGRLMPEEYAIHDFHQWVLTQMKQEAGK